MPSFKVIRKLPPPNVQMKTIRGEVIKQLQPVAQRYVSDRARITAKFRHKPEYRTSIGISELGVTLAITLSNARQLIGSGRTTLATLLMWLFETGTRAHPIFAKNARFLAFRSGGYSRKTEGGNGSAGGPLVFRKSVQHPGFAPSKRFEQLDKTIGRVVVKAINKAIKEGLNRAKNG